MKFIKSEVYKDIQRECYHSEILNKEAIFTCYADQCFNYEIDTGESHKQVFSIISRYEVFEAKMKVKRLLKLKGIKFLHHGIYQLNDVGEYKKVDERFFNSSKKATAKRIAYMKSIKNKGVCAG